MAYGYIMMIFVFLGAFIVVNRLKKANQKAEEETKEYEQYVERANSTETSEIKKESDN